MTPEKILASAPDAALQADDKLKRVIGPWGLGAAAVNIAVGAGIFVVPAFVAAILGPGAIVAYFVCGLAVALVLTCYIEIGSFVHRSGGGVAYVEEAFGPLMGFLAWVMYSIGYEVIACAALAVALLGSIAVWAPALDHGAPRILTLFAMFGGLAAVNVVGVRHGLGVAVASAVAKLVPLLLAIVAGILFVHWHQLRWTGWPSPAKLG
jgi:APA family basic amino acid/polyamine antiporter